MDCDSIQKQLLEKVAAAIKELRLPKLDPASVVVRRYPWRGTGQDITYHNGVSITPSEETESRGTNERDDIGFRAVITIVGGQAIDTAEDIAMLPHWRRKIRKRFAHVRLGVVEGGSNEIITTVRPGSYLTQRGVRGRYEVSVLVVTCWVRESTQRSERT